MKKYFIFSLLALSSFTSVGAVDSDMEDSTVCSETDQKTEKNLFQTEKNLFQTLVFAASLIRPLCCCGGNNSEDKYYHPNIQEHVRILAQTFNKDIQDLIDNMDAILAGINLDAVVKKNPALKSFIDQKITEQQKEQDIVAALKKTFEINDGLSKVFMYIFQESRIERTQILATGFLECSLQANNIIKKAQEYALNNPLGNLSTRPNQKRGADGQIAIDDLEGSSPKKAPHNIGPDNRDPGDNRDTAQHRQPPGPEAAPTTTNASRGQGN